MRFGATLIFNIALGLTYSVGNSKLQYFTHTGMFQAMQANHHGDLFEMHVEIVFFSRLVYHTFALPIIIFT